MVHVEGLEGAQVDGAGDELAGVVEGLLGLDYDVAELGWKAHVGVTH